MLNTQARQVLSLAPKHMQRSSFKSNKSEIWRLISATINTDIYFIQSSRIENSRIGLTFYIIKILSKFNGEAH